MDYIILEYCFIWKRRFMEINCKIWFGTTAYQNFEFIESKQ